MSHQPFPHKPALRLNRHPTSRVVQKLAPSYAPSTRHLAVVGVVLDWHRRTGGRPPTPQDRYQADRAACLQNNPNMDRDGSSKKRVRRCKSPKNRVP